MNFKEFHIGELIKARVDELKVPKDRISNFFDLSVMEVELMYGKRDILIQDLLKWSKLLEYDFFRLYSHHLILYAPPSKGLGGKKTTANSALPLFRKNVYSQELIRFVLEQIASGEMTRKQVVEQYRIPKSTLCKWESKYSESLLTNKT